MADNKDFSKWAWCIVKKTSSLKNELIQLDNRFDGLDGTVVRTNCFTSVDGTDCPVFEPWPFDRGMFSHKLNGPGLKCELAVCIRTSLIVWINGPFRGGKHDSVIFRENLSGLPFDDEAVECDAGCGNDKKLKTPDMGEQRSDRKMKADV